MKVAVGSVIYTQAESYFHDFFSSIDDQSEKEFDILILNDDVGDSDVLSYYEQKWGDRLKVISYKERHMEPCQLRIELLKRAKKLGYELLILCDCDDKCPDNRIRSILEQYHGDYTFFYNELRDFNGNQVFPRLPAEIRSIDPILEKNFLGLTNTALAMNQITDSFLDALDEGQTDIFDWYLFSRILLNKGSGLLIEGTYTYYRRHGGNIAGISNGDRGALEKECKVKIQHYGFLEKYDKRYKDLLYYYKNMKIGEQKEVDHGIKKFWWEWLQADHN